MTPWVQRLLIANVAVFFLQATSPELTSPFAFRPAFIITRPWTMVTYMFLHGGLMHLAFNMMGLFFFGPRVEERLGSKRFFVLYMISGVTGALFSFFFQRFAAVVGASGAIFGVMLAFAYFWPRDRIFIWGVLPIEARWLVIITTVLALYSGMTGSGGGVAHFAHLGGYAGAFVYLRWIGAAGERSRKKFRERAHGSVSNGALGNWRKVDASRIHALNREEVNRILDKISAHGLDSLTPQERLFLSNFVPPDDRM
jgi:membrane associated rhomboid family serine protease